MGKLRDKMIEDLQLRRLAPSTCDHYVDCAQAFAEYHWRSPEEMGEREVRQFLLHLGVDRQVGPATQKMYVAALKFLYAETLRRPEVVANIPWPKVHQKLPPILSGTEVDRLPSAAGASAPGGPRPSLAEGPFPGALRLPVIPRQD